MQFVAFDASYVQRLRSGDARTEAHFVSYFGDLIQLKLRTRVRSREAAEDIRQETFVRVLALIRSEGGVRQPERLGPLVASVCNHVLLEYYRSKGRSDAAIEDEPEENFVDVEPTALSRIEALEDERLVHQVLRELPERDRRLLQSVLLEERDKGAVCAEFGVTRDYLRVLVHRAKQSFKTAFIQRLRADPGSDGSAET